TTTGWRSRSRWPAERRTRSTRSSARCTSWRPSASIAAARSSDTGWRRRGGSSAAPTAPVPSTPSWARSCATRWVPTPAEPPAGGRPGGRSDATASYDDRVPAPASLHVAAFADLDAATLYALLRLRVDVFVVEQRCPYPELDGRDTEPATRHLWLELSRTPVAYLRILAEPDGAARIGRVVVAP